MTSQTADLAFTPAAATTHTNEAAVPLVSIVLPAYNEAAIISHSLERVAEYMKRLEPHYRWEMIVINDGSKDDTAAVVRRLMLGELRTVVVTGAEIGTLPGRRHLYARHLVNALDEEARRNLWRLARMALAGDRGSLFLELSATAPGLPDRVGPAEQG